MNQLFHGILLISVLLGAMGCASPPQEKFYPQAERRLGILPSPEATPEERRKTILREARKQFLKPS